jgi:hypothetical protein
MARYTDYDYAQTTRLPGHVDRQILPGPCEDPRHALLDAQSALAVCEARERNEAGGAPADAPAMLLQSMLDASAKGSLQSRTMAPRCRENGVCITLSAATPPPCTTLATFGSALSAALPTLFHPRFLGGAEAGRIGREMCARDGGKLPAQARTDGRGTQTALRQPAQTRHAAVAHLVSTPCAHAAREKIAAFLATHEDTLGQSGLP